MTVETDILQLQQDLVNLQAALETVRQTLQDQITFNVAGINEADTSADVATAATYVNAQDLTALDVTLRLYIDSQLDQLLLEITNEFNQALASSAPSVISQVTTSFIDQVNEINATIIAKTTEATAAAIAANDAYDAAATIFDGVLNNDLPGFENRLSAAEIIAATQENTLNGLLTDFAFNSLQQGFDSVDTTLNTFATQLAIDIAAVAADAAAAEQAAIDAALASNTATGAATAASASATAAATEAGNASTSASNAATSETNALGSKNAAATSATTAATSESNASDSATAAANSATAAATSATDAGTFATTASTHANNAATSASNALTSETNAASSATSATASAANASTSATTAATSATNAGNSATAASTSATNAATSATNAGNSATNAAASASAAASTYANITNDATGIQAAVDTLEVAVASLETGASAGYLVKAQANGTASLLSLVAADDGVSVPTSIAKISANDIILDGSVTARKLTVSDTSRVFSDSFENDTSIAEWKNYAGSGDLTSVTDSGATFGGRALKIGNNSGNDQAWLIHEANIPYDGSVTYRVRARVKKTAGTGAIYIGLAGVAANGTTLNNISGSNSYSSQHYIAASGAVPGSAYVEYVGYVKGWGSTGSGYSPNSDAPGVMENGTFYIRPLILANYSGAAGTYYIDFFSIDVMTDANLIVDGTITGNKVEALAIDTVHINTGAIKTGSIGGYEVKTDNLAPNAATTSVIDINSPLNFTAPSSAILGGRNSLSDFTTTGFYIGRTSSNGTTADGFQLSHTSVDENNDITGVIHDGINGFRIVNPTFLAQSTTSTPNIIRTATNQTITLVKGAVHTVTVVGGGGGGGGASWESSSKTGTYHGTAGSAGGNTTVTLTGATGYSGTRTWTALGGAGGARGEDNTNHWTKGTGTTATAPDGENAGYGDGGEGGAGVPINQVSDYAGNNGGNAPSSNYGAGGGGGSSASNDMSNESWWGNPGGGGKAGKTLTVTIDLTSASTNGTLTVSAMGTGGSGGAGYSTSGDGGNGASGVVILNSELDKYGKFTLQDLHIPVKQNATLGGAGIPITAFTSQSGTGGIILGPFTEDKYFSLEGTIYAGYNWTTDTWHFILYSSSPSTSSSWANTQSATGNGMNYSYSSITNGYTTPTSTYAEGNRPTPGTLLSYTTYSSQTFQLLSVHITGYLQAGDTIRHVGQWSNQYTYPSHLNVTFYGLGI